MTCSWADTQAAFAASLLDPELPVPAGVGGTGSRRGFAVYRNNVAASLVDVLQDRFAVTTRLVGEEFFRAMARSFAMRYPPRSPLLMEYGGEFPAFIEHFEPASTVPYLADVARFEVAWSEAYNASDAEAMPARALSGVAPEELLQMQVSLHPATRILRSAYPVATLWAAHQSADPSPEMLAEVASALSEASGEAPGKGAAGEDVLIVRPRAEVHVHRLPAGGHAFIAALAAGADVQSAAVAGLAEDTHFDVGQNTLALLDAGAVTALGRPARQEPETEP